MRDRRPKQPCMPVLMRSRARAAPCRAGSRGSGTLPHSCGFAPPRRARASVPPCCVAAARRPRATRPVPVRCHGRPIVSIRCLRRARAHRPALGPQGNYCGSLREGCETEPDVPDHGNIDTSGTGALLRCGARARDTRDPRRYAGGPPAARLRFGARVTNGASVIATVSVPRHHPGSMRVDTRTPRISPNPLVHSGPALLMDGCAAMQHGAIRSRGACTRPERTHSNPGWPAPPCVHTGAPPSPARGPPGALGAAPPHAPLLCPSTSTRCATSTCARLGM